MTLADRLEEAAKADWTIKRVDGNWMAFGPSEPQKRYVVVVADHTNAKGEVVAGPLPVGSAKAKATRLRKKKPGKEVRVLFAKPA